jgi:hypothetical protein
MQKGPKPAELMVSEQERKGLDALMRRHSTPQQVAKRIRIVLLAAEGNASLSTSATAPTPSLSRDVVTGKVVAPSAGPR